MVACHQTNSLQVHVYLFILRATVHHPVFKNIYTYGNILSLESFKDILYTLYIICT